MPQQTSLIVGLIIVLIIVSVAAYYVGTQQAPIQTITVTETTTVTVTHTITQTITATPMPSPTPTPSPSPHTFATNNYSKSNTYTNIYNREVSAWNNR